MSTDDLRKRLAGLNRGPFASSLSRASELVDAIDRRQRITRRGDLAALIPGCERAEDGASIVIEPAFVVPIVFVACPIRLPAIADAIARSAE